MQPRCTEVDGIVDGTDASYDQVTWVEIELLWGLEEVIVLSELLEDEGKAGEYGLL